MLCRKPLVGRCDRSVDVADLDDPAVWRPFQHDLIRQIGELDERLALGQRRQAPRRKTERPEPGQGRAPLEHVTTSGLLRHVVDPFLARLCGGNR